jgi:hypothetical protein
MKERRAHAIWLGHTRQLGKLEARPGHGCAHVDWQTRLETGEPGGLTVGIVVQVDSPESDGDDAGG